MRAFVPAVGAALGGAFLLGNDFLTSIARILFGPGSGGGAAFALAALSLATAGAAAPRVRRGVDGWLRHLPARGADQRRAVAWAVTAAQTPLLLALILLAAFGSLSPESLAVDALALAVSAYGAAHAAVPARRGFWTRPLAAAAAAVAPAGSWEALALGTALAIAADLASGELPRAPAAPLAPRRRRSGGSPGAGRWLAWRLAARALGARAAGAYLIALLPLGAAWAFLHHNELRREHVELGARLGLAAALVLALSSFGETLAVRRPAWPWSRSLPWSARARVRSDAVFLALLALPLLALGLAFEPVPALWVAPLLPFLALRCAGALRRAPEAKSGAAGAILGEGMLLAAASALFPWIAFAALLALPWAERQAAERERRQKVSRWLELHHLAVGDPQSWSGH